MKTYEMFQGEDLKIADRILHCRLLLLVHSKIYYDLDSNIISDKKWGELAMELVNLQTTYPEISEQVDWYEDFADWDGSTGAFLPLNDEWVVRKAKELLRGSTPTKKSNFKISEKIEKPAAAKSVQIKLF